MGSLLDRIKGVDNDPDNEFDNTPEIPDEVPEDWAAELADDPPPASVRSIAPLAPKTFGKVTPALKKRIAAEIEAYIELAAMPLAMRDPICGGAVHQQAAPMAKAVADILARYPEVAHKFLATGVLGDWLKMFMVVQPIVTTVWAHHVVHTVGVEEVPDDAAEFDQLRAGR